MKEHKCKKCGLTFKGYTNYCPYCHKRTKYGTINNIMAVIGYLTTASIILTLVYLGLIAGIATSIALIPTAIFIALIIGIVILILK